MPIIHETNSNNSVLQEAEIREKAKELFLSKLTKEKIEEIKAEHMRLSEGLGTYIGLAADHLAEKEFEMPMESLFSQHEKILYAITYDKIAEFTKSQNRDIILSFLRSKDDNLLLLVGGLIMFA